MVDVENVQARAVALKLKLGEDEQAKALSKKESPTEALNNLLRLSNLPIKIDIREHGRIVAQRHDAAEYGIHQLSDGERAALIIAANVLTAKPGTLFLVDEPERHLHRSIISPLLTRLFAKRSDCAFVISTHDILLPLDNPGARTVLLRGCTFAGGVASKWDADLVAAGTPLDDELKRDILGGRRKLLFVEGTQRSLDLPLYSLIFPEVSVIAKTSCRDVEHAVAGIRGSEDTHWLKAWGIVDNDRRPAEDISRLQGKGVHALPIFSVESIYYHPIIQERLANRQCGVLGGSPQDMLDKARTEAAAEATRHIQRLSERVVEAALRREVMRKLPRQQDIAAGQPITIDLDVPSVVSAEKERLQQACETRDVVTIVSRYPIRETPALSAIARSLGFQGCAHYESAALKLLMDDATALEQVRALFGDLPAEIAAA